MNIYVITECYQDYKGASATPYGVFKCKESAKISLTATIIERFGYILEDMGSEEAEEWVKSNWRSGYTWEYDDGDSTTTFYIDALTLED